MNLFGADVPALQQAIVFHSIFALLMILPFLWYLKVLFTYKTYLNMNQKIFFIMPLTFFLIAVNFFTGIFVHSMVVFETSLKAYFMLIVTLVFLAGEITRMVKLKRAKTSKETMEKYVKFCKIMYITFIILYFIVVIIAYLT